MTIHTVIFEGNIGVGKSTLMANVAKALPHVHVIAVYEAVDEWTNVGGHNLMSLMYHQPRPYAAFFQMAVLASRGVQLSKAYTQARALSAAGHTVLVLCERSMWSGRHVFVAELERVGRMDPAAIATYHVYWDWHASVVYTEPIAGIVYVYDAPTACYARTKARGRSEETEIPLAYFEQIDAAYAAYLQTDNTFNRLPIATVPVSADMVDGAIAQIERLTGATLQRQS